VAPCTYGLLGGAAEQLWGPETRVDACKVPLPGRQRRLSGHHEVVLAGTEGGRGGGESNASYRSSEPSVLEFGKRKRTYGGTVRLHCIAARATAPFTRRSTLFFFSKRRPKSWRSNKAVAGRPLTGTMPVTLPRGSHECHRPG